MIRFLRPLLCISTIAAALPGSALAQQPVTELLGREATPEGQPKIYLAHALTQEAPAAPMAAPAEPWFLMESLKGMWLGRGLESAGTSVYGWVQQGAAWNIDSPRDRINFGANFDWRSNDYRLNQVYFVVEKALAHEEKWNVGYRVDFLVGHDAPFFVANGCSVTSRALTRPRELEWTAPRASGM